MSIERDICTAIDIITSSAVAASTSSTTVSATVIECINPIVGKYSINYQDTEFTAYSNNIFNFYNSGAIVRVLLTNGSIDGDKIILNAIDDSTKMVYNNIYLNNLAFKNPIEKYLYSEKKMEHLSRIIKRSPYFAFNFIFENGVDVNKLITLKIEITINKNKIVIFEDTQTVRDFQIGNFNQIIQNYHWGEVSNLKIYSTGGITPKDFEIIGVEDIDIADAYKGILELNVSNKKIKANISLLGHSVSENEIDNFQFYWFIEDETITKNNLNFNYYGGEGWKCLNNKYQTMWRKGKSEYSFGEQAGTFKCVAILDNHSFSRTITVV